MGAFLDKPITDKDTHEGAHGNLSWGLASMQGWRVEMEDAHTALGAIPGLPDHAFFGVYDGHGGKTVSTLLGDGLVPCIMKTKEIAAGGRDVETLSKAVQRGMLDFDEQLKQDYPTLRSGEDRSGSTVIVALVTPTHYIIGNCGDSRCILVNDGLPAFASEDHKPSNPEESARIRNANGYVEIGRVCGNLAVSRSLGDFMYKDMPELPAEAQKVSGEADMTILEKKDGHQFLVLACDGIWDVMSNEDVADYVLRRRLEGLTDLEISVAVLDHCLELGSKDNMSCVVVTLPGAPKPDPAARRAVDADSAANAPPPLTPGDREKISKRLSVRATDSERAQMDEATFEPGQ